jgi:hypothetical protein
VTAMQDPLPYEPSLLRHRKHVLPLPEHDPVIDAMPPELRLEVARTWERRAHEELKVAAAFSVLCRELLETYAEPEVLALVSRAVHDEVRHAEVCRTLASRYASVGLPWPDEVVIEPSQAKIDARLRAAFHLVTMCCVNEAIACSFLDACLAGSTSPCAQAAVGDLLADEVLHARVGWMFAAKQPRPMLRAIEANLLTLVQPVVHCWWEEGAITMPDGAPEHGIPSAATTRASMLAAMRDIVLPGFERLGFDVGATRSWLADWQPNPG